MDDANVSASIMRSEMEKIKKTHALELAEVMEDTEDVRSALAAAEQNVEALENEVRFVIC